MRAPVPVLGDTTEDGEPVSRLRTGDERAAQDLFDRYHARIVGRMRRWTSDPATAEDLAQDTWARCLVGFHRFDVTRPLWPWLRTVADNVARSGSALAQMCAVAGPVGGLVAGGPGVWRASSEPASPAAIETSPEGDLGRRGNADRASSLRATAVADRRSHPGPSAASPAGMTYPRWSSTPTSRSRCWTDGSVPARSVTPSTSTASTSRRPASPSRSSSGSRTRTGRRPSTTPPARPWPPPPGGSATGTRRVRPARRRPGRAAHEPVPITTS